MNKLLYLGVMSGTSLDGLDLLLAEFEENNKKYNYKIIAAKTINYSKDWKQKLETAFNLSAQDLLLLHNEYGKFIAEKCNNFISKIAINKAVVICSHGHTVFHQPEKRLTFQLGSGAEIAANSGCTVINDFRSLDVALGGQGAPLVPIGDFYLFNEYPFCLNLGGIANISIQKGDKITAYDICPCNMVLNFLVSKIDKEYDENGKIAASGNIIEALLQELNQLDFYKQMPPKSLGREWFENIFKSILDNYKNEKTANLLATACEHIAIQIAENINRKNLKGQCLITGGGTHNNYLVSRIQVYLKNELKIPKQQLIDFKEALIFAFMGYLKMNNKINCFSSVTGAKRDSIVGNKFTP